MEEELLTTTELCKWLKVTRSTIWKWRQKGMPSMGERGSLRFKASEVENWLREKQSVSEK